MDFLNDSYKWCLSTGGALVWLFSIKCYIGVIETPVCVCFYTVRLKLALSLFPCPSKNVRLKKLFRQNLQVQLISRIFYKKSDLAKVEVKSLRAK